jgi:hypothetical protein
VKLLDVGIGAGLMALGIFVFWRAIESVLKDEKQQWISPFTEKLIRPAGEGLRLLIEAAREKLIDHLLLLVFLLLLPGWLALMIRPLDHFFNQGVLLATLIGAYAVAWRKWPKIKGLREDLRRLRLGFDGERYVAEELNQLMRQGYRVFHDFVVDWKPGCQFNIDHVLVGPDGVFVVETKTRSKKRDPGSGNKLGYQVEFDGEAIRFPGGPWSTAEIDQAKGAAKELRNWLKRSGQSWVEVRALVAIPGWWVEAENLASSGVQPVKGLATRIPGLGRVRLNPGQIQTIGDCIETHCRNLTGV